MAPSARRAARLLLVSLLCAAAQDEAVCPEAQSYPPRELAGDGSHCTAAKIPDLRPYRHGHALGAADQDGVQKFFPYFSTLPLSEKAPEGIKTAVIYSHGLFGNANKFFCDGVSTAQAAGAAHSTVTIAPWFGDVQMSGALWSDNVDSRWVSTCWASASYITAGNSHSGATSSYDMLDALVEMLRDTRNFPELELIVVSGFSAGCQTVSRWAFFSQAPSAAGVPVRVVVGDCASYLYLDEMRPDRSCNEMWDTGENHTCSSFVRVTEQQCPGFNAFKHGLDLTHLEFPSSYVGRFDRAMLEQAINEFPKKDFRMLTGSGDVCNCRATGFRNEEICFHADVHCQTTAYPGCCDTYPDGNNNVLDKGCSSMVTGSNRLQRALNYRDALRHLFARRGVAYSAPMAFFEGQHDNDLWAKSAAFARWANWATGAEPEVVVL